MPKKTAWLLRYPFRQCELLQNLNRLISGHVCHGGHIRDLDGFFRRVYDKPCEDLSLETDGS